MSSVKSWSHSCKVNMVAVSIYCFVWKSAQKNNYEDRIVQMQWHMLWETNGEELGVVGGSLKWFSSANSSFVIEHNGGWIRSFADECRIVFHS